MKTIVCLISTLCLGVLPGSSQSPPPAFSITLSASRATIKAGSDVRVRLILLNTSSREIFIPSQGPSGPGQGGPYVEVRDSQGHLATLTPYYRAIHSEGESGSQFTSKVAPGKTYESELLINKLYDLTKPGRYTIQVHRSHAPDQPVIKSNAITITVER